MFISQKRNQWPAVNLLAALFLAITFSVISGCQSEKEQIYSYTGLTMGTTFSVKWVASNDKDRPRISALINDELLKVNRSMSTYIPDSELSLFNQLPAGSQKNVSERLTFLLSLALSISDESEGAFDVTVGPLVNLWGFGPDGRVVKSPSEQQIQAVMEQVGYTSVHLKGQRLHKEKNSYIDLSAIAKGYGVDVIADLLEAEGISSYLVEIGGELRAKGLKPDGMNWRIAIESPLASLDRQIHKVISVKDVGIATSGDYRNYFEENGVRFSHTIDPQTARPISHKLASVTVLAKTCAEADAYATAIMVMGPDQAIEFSEKQGIQSYMLVKTDQGFKELMTPGFVNYLVQ